jgi:RNA polymerase sigma-70 factor (ECF subfamily)
MERMTGKFKKEFESVWAGTAGRMRAYMFCACGSWADADDLLQDCYLRALQGWGQFDGSGSRKSWLFGIARRTCADWFRQKKRERAAVSLEKLGESGQTSPGTQRTDEIEAVWEVVKGLSAEQSEVIHLRFAAELSYDEIGQVVGIPLGTVRSRLHRGLRAVREKIEE